jgi:hypothetical protein
MTNEEIFRLAEQHGDWDDFGRWMFKNDDQLLKFVKAIAEANKPKMRRATREEKIVNPGVYEVPVAWAEITKEYVAVCNESFENAIPLYTKREWVGLTDEDLEAVFPAIATYHESNKTLYRSVAHVIEAKLKEKNT